MIEGEREIITSYLLNIDTWKILFLLLTTCYHAISNKIEQKTIKPPGELIGIGGTEIHLYTSGEGNITVILEHSLGGIEGYFLVNEIAKITKVCMYDRAGYGWSQSSWKPRTSQQIVKELHVLLNKANIQPPYILLGDSFGSYNMRLYAHLYPEEVVGIVLTDGLHEQSMLAMPISIIILKLFFTFSFAFVSLGAAFGIVRFLGIIGVFELLKPELRKFSPASLQLVKKCFYSAKHWLTMFREMWSLDASSKQVRKANDFGDIPVINIKAATFLKPTLGKFKISIPPADKLRDKMQSSLLNISNNCQQVIADKSSHFVWIDQPEVIQQAVIDILRKVKKS